MKPVNRTIAVIASANSVGYDTESSIDELCELCETAGAEVVAKIIQKLDRVSPATYLGEGKINEMALICGQLGADIAVFDDELSSSQIRNIENILNVRVIDRTMLILDIFASRAVSGEGKLQVELAQLKYRLPRLAGIGISMSRLGGGIGTRGPGETQLETDRRHIRRRISKLSADLKELETRRGFMRSRRKKSGVMVGAIVGYTNAGKSTLLNMLTEAGVLTEDKLFATLDLTSRAITLPDGRSLTLVDTVGLIRRLPHHLVEAFKSTLEEAKNADIILHVADISDPECFEKSETAAKILAELGCGGIPMVNIFNKRDKIEFVPPGIIAISAKTGEGLDGMLSAIAKALPETAKRMILLVPYGNAGLIAKIRESGTIYLEEYIESGIKIDALVDVKLIKESEIFLI
ncbi:MAG: GTPase HflX [Eubacterium sp.]|nr:GTPase HflX [Eubacterium sp.]